jgi:hypothetical protein
MTFTSKTALTWQAKTAYVCAALFALTSISTNAVYGFYKGDTLPSSLIWAVLAIATGATLLLSTAALFKSLAARSWGQAAFIALGLSLCATYSIVAAVGSATGQRMTAALTEDNASSRRTDSQKAVDQATAELAKLPTPERPSNAIQAELDGILIDLRLEGCTSINGPRTREKCPHVAELKTELASAQTTEASKSKWQTQLDKARTQIANLPPPKVVNSDAQAVVNFLKALGYDPTVAQVNTALALLSVLLIEMGGSVSLAVGMAFSLDNKSVREPLSKEEEKPLLPTAPLVTAETNKDGRLKGLHEVPKQALVESFTSVRDQLLSDVAGNKGGLRSTYEALGVRYGVSATRIGQIVRDLKKEGLVRVCSSRSGPRSCRC